MAIGASYAFDKLQQAKRTAQSSTSEVDRRNARKRVKEWTKVLDSMRSGRTRIGSRSPVVDAPVWATPQVVRGGFATGALAAGGELAKDEMLLATDVGVVPSRWELFRWWVSDDGIDRLISLLDSGRYRVTVPEHGALLSFAWLYRNGHAVAALDLLVQISPHARTLRFAPVEAAAPDPGPTRMWRLNARQVCDALSQRRVPDQLARMRETLAVWNPFGDELLGMWLETIDGDRVAARISSEWLDRLSVLSERYDTLASAHVLCSKHRKPKENLGILVGSMQRTIAGAELTPRELGLLKHAVDSMVAKRGAPGSESLELRRAEDASMVAGPLFADAARVLADELGDTDPSMGLEDGIRADSMSRAESALGSPLPAPVARTLDRARIGTLDDLVEHGLVPSAEVLAELTPAISADALSAKFDDANLRSLYASIASAFASRRSLLLLNYEKQVQLAELPWVAALDAAADTSSQASAPTLHALARRTITLFPGTVIPNPMITQLRRLTSDASISIPWTEELAADIFMGGFSPKFVAAAKLAAPILRDSIYERYYGLDYAAIAAFPEQDRPSSNSPFAKLCQDRVGSSGGAGHGYSPARNGAVIEQAQIITTHNLAAIAGLGVQPADGDWIGLAGRARDVATALASNIGDDRRSRRLAKEAAYAWRHMLFFMAMAERGEQERFVSHSEAMNAVTRLGPAWSGLAQIADGGSFESIDGRWVCVDDRGVVGAQLVGWARDRRHWLIAGI